MKKIEAANSALPDARTSARTAPTQEEQEPGAGPPVLEDGAMGLQQLLIGGKTVKDNTMPMCYSASADAILKWRPLRKRYLRSIRTHNATNAIKLQARPVRDFVDKVIWEAVSIKKLKPHHRTKPRQDPNHIECRNYFIGAGEYKGMLDRDHKDPLELLKSVKYQKGRAGATHEDRWFSYMSRRNKALEMVPDAQLENKIFQRAHAAHLRHVIRPSALKQHVANAFRTGIEPATSKYNEKWLLETKNSVANTEEVIEAVIEY